MMTYRFLTCIFLTCFSTTFAQGPVINPSNKSFLTPTDHQIVLVITQTGDKYNIDPLTTEADLSSNGQQPSDIDGALILSIDPGVAKGLNSNDIAFLGCDPNLYPGQIHSGQTLGYAAGSNPTAIILYSVNSSRCTFNASSDFDFQYIYTLTIPESSTGLATMAQPPADILATIRLASRSENGTSDSGPFTKSPTTAVAMIILYSITGIITALFLVIIIVGAIRAHRHPERYGPRHVLGRPRQSRAKGIARAMLETIPIVKFGDKEEDKPVTQARDVELAPAGQHRSSAAPEAEGSSTDGPVKDDKDSTGPEIVKTETAPGTSKHIEGESGLTAHTDNGLACSVCTDDFVKGQDIRVLPCKHKFHPECIDPWLLNVSGTCPLCRVDLRPTATSPTDPDRLEIHRSPSSANHVSLSVYDLLSSPLTPNSLNPPEPAASRAPNRRSRTGLSLYIQNTLNSRRMRDATPEERIAALRDLRSARQADSATVEPRPRHRLSSRLSLPWTSSSRPPSGVHTTTAAAAAETSAPTPDPVDLPEMPSEGRRT